MISYTSFLLRFCSGNIRFTSHTRNTWADAASVEIPESRKFLMIDDLYEIIYSIQIPCNVLNFKLKLTQVNCFLDVDTSCLSQYPGHHHPKFLNVR